MNEKPLYALAAEFDSPEKLVEAARAVREAGYLKFEVYGPYPIKDLEDIVPAPDSLLTWLIGPNPVPAVVLTAGVLGTLTAWVLQFYIAVIDYPTNVGGRPLNSWPAFVPIMFELTVLFAAVAAFFITLYLPGLPALHHPIFNLQRIARASKDRFFLCIEAKDAAFSLERTDALLHSFEPLKVLEIEED